MTEETKDREQSLAASCPNERIVSGQQPTEYDCLDSCNKCGGRNEYRVTDTLDGRLVMEAKTKCLDCGHDDYWAHGFFESGAEIVGKCTKYSFGR